MKRLILSVALFAEFLSSAHATTSEEYATMGRRAWAAFSCAAIASAAKNGKEHDRLFEVGYSQGKQFLASVEAGKLDAADANRTVPIGVLFVMQGPSPDFVLGRIWEAASQDATKDIYSELGDDIQLMRAQTEFTKRNCGVM